MKGSSFVICFRNKPFAEIRPLAANSPSNIKFGALSGQFEVPKDFDKPLSEFESDFYADTSKNKK